MNFNIITSFDNTRYPAQCVSYGYGNNDNCDDCIRCSVEYPVEYKYCVTESKKLLNYIMEGTDMSEQETATTKDATRSIYKHGLKTSGGHIDTMLEHGTTDANIIVSWNEKNPSNTIAKGRIRSHIDHLVIEHDAAILLSSGPDKSISYEIIPPEDLVEDKAPAGDVDPVSEAGEVESSDNTGS